MPFPLFSATDVLMLLAHPVISFLVASALVVVVTAFARSSRVRAARNPDESEMVADAGVRYEREKRALRLGAFVVLGVYFTEFVVRGYLLELSDVVEWWQYATALAAASAVLLGIAVLIAAVHSRPPREPVLAPAPRRWTSFGSRRSFLLAGVVTALLLITTIAAGLASSSDERERFIHLEIPVPNTSVDPVRPWFYGWAFGVPVLVCVALLVLALWLTLRANAVRPFSRPATIAVESGWRTQVSDASVRIGSAAVLLALGGAWTFVGRSGGVNGLIQTDVGGVTRSYVTGWQFDELATVLQWLAPVAQIGGFALLLLVLAPMLPPRRVVSHTDAGDAFTTAAR